MLTQALSLAVLAAISPTALLVSAIFLGSASPRRTVALYLAGAIAMTAVMAVLVFVVLRAGNLNKLSNHQPRYGLRLGLGVVCILAAGYLFRRGPRPPDPAKEGKGFINKLVARPGSKTAVIVGVLVYSPSVTFVAAVQAVATSDSSVAAAVGAIALVIGITVVFVWLPLVLYLIEPEKTGRTLASFNGWLRSHGHILLVGSMTVAGVILIIDGILGLTGAA